MASKDPTSELLGLFGQSYGQGAQIGSNFLTNVAQLQQQQRQLDAQKQAQQFRQGLQQAQEGRAAESFGRQSEMDKMNLQLAKEKFAGRFDAAAEAARRQKLEEDKKAADLEKTKADTSLSYSRAAKLRQERQDLSYAAKNKQEADRKLAEFDERNVSGSAALNGADFQEHGKKATNLVEKYIRMRNASSTPMKEGESKALRTAARGLTDLNAKQKDLLKAFTDVSKITGIANLEEALATAAGRISIVRAISSHAGTNARKLQDLNAKLRLMVIAMQKAEPNNRRAQDLIQLRFHIGEGTTKQELEDVLNNVFTELGATRESIRGTLEAYPGLYISNAELSGPESKLQQEKTTQPTSIPGLDVGTYNMGAPK